MDLQDLPPDNDPLGGSPRPKTPRPIPISEFDEGDLHDNFITQIGSSPALRELLVWVFRALAVLAFFYLRATFVTNEKYDAEKGNAREKLQEISTTLVRIDEKLGKGGDTDRDHEARLRELERGKPTSR